MGRFPWTQGHTKHSSNDKQNVITSEWMLRSNVEPSRQALAELMKEHGPNRPGHKSQRSSGSRTRSRTNTTSSSTSNCAPSDSDGSQNPTSRPVSQQSLSDAFPDVPTLDRQESSARNLFSKGSRLLRKQSSKLSLLPSGFEDVPFASSDEAALTLTAALFRDRHPTLSPKRSGQKPSISGPFGFQHVTHTEQGQFQSLDKVAGIELVSEFSALQADQQSDATIRGIPVNDLPMHRKTSINDATIPPSPISSTMPELPVTPPKPSPPAKDSVKSPHTPSDVRLSRSTENFSRPSRSSGSHQDEALTFSVRTPASAVGSGPPSPQERRSSIAEGATSRAGSRRNSAAQASAMAKPLPLLPSIVHAVSTPDDSSRLLRTAPLPRPPVSLADVPEEEDLMTPDVGHLRMSLRHVQTFPASKNSKRRSQSSGEVNFETLNEVLKPSSSEYDIRSASKSMKMKGQSMRTTSIGIEDWEDAIDYSWEHPEELQNIEPINAALGLDTTPDVPQEQLLLVEQPRSSQVSSSASTPLMMRPASRNMAVDEALPSPTWGASTPNIVNVATTGDNSSTLHGLGIGDFKPQSAAFNISAFPLTPPATTDDTAFPFDTHHNTSSGRRGDPGSPMSKSSSQESIILSIASSILGTHRSSNSSTCISLADFPHLANCDDLSFSDSPKPEDIRRAASLESEGHVSDASVDTVLPGPLTEEMPVTTTTTKVVSPTTNNTSSRHSRVLSASRIPVPERKSSIAGTERPPLGARKRSSTMASSAKRPSRTNARASYSLFPSTATSTATASVTPAS